MLRLYVCIGEGVIVLGKILERDETPRCSKALAVSGG